MEKPQEIIAEELKNKIASAINESGINIFMLDGIITDLYYQTKELKRIQLTNTVAEYQKSLCDK